MKKLKSVNMKFRYSLCAVVSLLTISLSTKAQGPRTGSGTSSDPYEFNWETSGDGIRYENSFYNDQSNLINDWGASNSGNDCWIKITVTTTGTLTVGTGTVSGSSGYDAALHLVDASKSYDLTYNDDDPIWAGSSLPYNATISYTVSPGVYYIVLDGTDKPYVYPNPSPVRNGGVNVVITIN